MSDTARFQALPGFREFYPEDCAARNFVFGRWREVARRHGFSEYDIPILEPLDLYTEKSGEEIVGQLFNFTDKGGRAVSLRPELTPSLARLVGSKANGLRKPVKWFAIGENFRYEKMQRGRLRSHYQLNCDIFGEPGPGAEAELIAVCLGSLTTFGLGSGDLVLRLSDRVLWAIFLEGLGLDAEGIRTVLGIIDKLEREEPDQAVAKLRPTLGERAPEFLGQVRDLVSRRTVDDLAAFCAAHLPTGPLAERAAARLAEWRVLLERIEAFGLAPLVRIDLGIVRGLAYYTGFVFEIFELGSDGLEGRALAGGGRYDHLVGKFGYPPLPALGFGMGDVTLTELLRKKNLVPPFADGPDLFLILGGPAETRAGLAEAARLRDLGWRVAYPLRETGFGKQFKLAGESGARWAVIFGSEELARGEVKVRDLRSGEESAVARPELGDFLAGRRA